MTEGLSHEIAQFILLHVDSLELLDVLVVLSHKPLRPWNLEEIDSVIRSSASSIRRRLERLSALELISISGEPPRYSFAQGEKTIELATKLLDAYQRHRVEVTELIYKKPMKEVISFSDAFRVRKGSKDNG